MSDGDRPAGEIRALAAQLEALTAAVDRLTHRIDALEPGIAEPGPAVAALDFDEDPFAWPTEAELVRYLADRAPGDNC
jgi:hypothetical protein